MKGMVMEVGGGKSSLKLQELNIPAVRDDEVLLKVVASGVNRCDLQTEEEEEYEEYEVEKVGPGSTGCSCWFTTTIKKPPHCYYYCPGHECSGTIIAIGRFVTEWNIGDKVCAILDKGGYAEQVAVPAKHLLPIPTNVSFADAASLPLAACNIWLALFSNPEERPIKTVLIHEGASKFGSMAIQFAKYKGIKVIATAGSRKELSLCEDLGADACINQYTGDWVDTVMNETKSHGVDLILDYRLTYVSRNIECLKHGGKLLIVDLLLQGREADKTAVVNLADILTKNTELQVSDIRAHSTDQKAFIIGEVPKLLWPAIEQGKVTPKVGHRLPLTAAGAATLFVANTLMLQNVILYS